MEQNVVATARVSELSGHCPSIACGESIASSKEFLSRCTNCQQDLFFCHACNATNRLLAMHCRGCGRTIETEIRPMQTGLSSVDYSFSPIETIDHSRATLRTQMGVRILAHPAAATGVVVVSLLNGNIVLLSELDGRELGRLAVHGEIGVTPALNKGFLYAAAGREVTAFDVARFLDSSPVHESKAMWTLDLGGIIAHPVLADENAIYLVSQAGNSGVLHAVSQRTGQLIWSEPLTVGPAESLPCVLIEGQLLCVTSDGPSSLIDTAAGRILHAFTLGFEVDSQVSPFVIGNRAMVCDVNGNVASIVVSRGRASVNLLYNNRVRVSTVSANESYVAVGHLAGLTLLSSHGSLLWSHDSLESISVAPVIAGGTIFAVDDSGTGLLFDTATSNPKIRVKLSSGLITIPPLVTRSKVVVVSGDGEVIIVTRT